MSGTGYVDTWVEDCRILLPDVPVSSHGAVADAGDTGGDDTDDTASEIDFDVPPR
jgi:hypothetical protein